MKAKTIALASAGAGAVAAGTAAFVPTAQAAPPTPAPLSWEGFYIGIHVGGASTDNHVASDLGYGISTDLKTGTASFIGGGQIGYNFQNGNFVYGFEVDGSWLSGSGKVTDESGGVYGTHFSWLATVRGRFGVAFGSWLAYATGGAAFTTVKTFAPDVACCVILTNHTYSKVRTGWAFGGGVQHQLDPRWIVGAEVLLVDFGVHQSGKSRVSNSALIGRFKLDYKFP